ncbi:MAG TPA: kelch repeat-containing protein [Gemmatimonadales bacterium]|nr:kelch repeat-containing protein [Gemmatimonadales bacterium]
MKFSLAFRLTGLAPLALLVACTETRNPPSAPSLTVDRVAATRSAVPSPRGTLQLVHDPLRDRLYLVGGISPVPCQDLSCANSLIDDLWSFNPRARTWREISDQLPPREGDAAALDSRSRRIIMFQPFFSLIPETWAYDIDKRTWENRHPAVEPPARWGSMMVYDARADRALLFGGAALSDNGGLNDLWAYDYESNTWTELQPVVSPPPHQWHALVYVPTSDRTVLFGGTNPSDGTLLNDTWAYDYHRNRWTNLHPIHPPTPRMTHYMAFEPTTNMLVLFGGFLAPYDQAAGDTWIYDVAKNRWRQAFPKASPGPRAFHVMSRTNGPVVLFGGGPDQAGWTNETFLYDSRENAWEQVTGGDSDAHLLAGDRSSAAPGQMARGRWKR